MASARRPLRRHGCRGLGALAALAWVASALSLALPVAAQEAKEAPAQAGSPAPEAAPSVHLDQLLKLPDEGSYTIEKRGGLSRGEWRELFQKVRGRLETEKKALAAAEAKMDEVARGTNPWKVGPAIPGMSSTSDAPLDYKLQQEIKQRRESVKILEDELRQLNIKADLAGVPADWRS